MTPVWLNNDTGEIYEGGACPNCAQTVAEADMLIAAAERDIRPWKLRATKAETKLAAETATRRDKAEWQRVLDTWLTVFPDEPKIRSITVKSARASEYFARTDTGPLEADVLNAIYGAKERPYLTYGRRTATTSGESVRAVDIAEICAVKGKNADANFELLAAIGKKVREAQD